MVKITFDQNKFKEYLLNRVSPSSAKSYSTDVSIFINWIDKKKAKTEDELIDLIAEFIYKRPRNWHLRFAIKHYFEYINKIELYNKMNIKHRRRFKKMSRLKLLKSLPFNTIRTMAEMLPIPYNIIMMLQYDTAGRIGDILALKYNNIHINDDSSIELDYVEEKTNKPRSVLITLYTARKLAKYITNKKLNEGDKLFTTSQHVYNDWLHKAGAKVGYPEFSSHWVRHSRAINLYAKIKDPKTIQLFLNHSNLQTTDDYLKTAGLSNRDIMKKNPIEWV